MTGSVYLTISLTVERYFSVVKPFKYLRNRYLRSSFALALPGILFSFAFTLPNYFMLTTVSRKSLVLSDYPINSTLITGISQEDIECAAKTNSIINMTSGVGGGQEVVVREGHLWLVLARTATVSLEFAKFRSDPVYIKVYVMWLHLVFNSVLPFSLLLYLNYAIYKRLVGQRNVRRTAEGQLRRREVRLARISLSIVFIFILCHSLKILPSFLEILGKSPETIPGLLPLSHLLITINCSVNFLVYFMASGKALSSFLPSMRRSRRTRRMSGASIANSQTNENQTQVSEVMMTPI